MDDGVLVVDSEGQVRLRNPRAARMLDSRVEADGGLGVLSEALLERFRQWRQQSAEVVEMLDDELRRLGQAYGPLPDDECPLGLPRSHWWWWPAPLPGGPHERYKGWDEPR